MNAVAYCRYSTNNQTENSIMYQLNAINEYCSKHDLNVINIYTDEAMSGTNTDRNGLQRLIADAKTQQFKAIVIYDQSRLSRNIVDWFTFRDMLRQYDISIFSCTETIENYDDNSSSFLSEGIRALFNQQYVLDARRKTIAGQTSKAKQGAFLGGTPPLGYDIVNGAYVINEFEADAIRFIFESYLCGTGYGTIVSELKNRGLKSKHGAIISTNAIHYILKNERYAGVYSWNNVQQKYLRKFAGNKPNPNAVRLEDGMPAIIEKQKFEEVKRRMTNNKNRAANSAKREYLLSGIVKCGKCEGSFVGVTKTNPKGYETSYYVCSNKRRLKNCDCKNINAGELEVLVVMVMKREILNQENIERIADQILEGLKTYKGDTAKVKREIASLDHKIMKIKEYAPLAPTKETAMLIMEQADVHRKQKAALELQLRDFQQTTPPTKSEIIDILMKDIAELQNDPKKIKELLKKYVVNVKITDEYVEINSIGDVTFNGCGGQI